MIEGKEFVVALTKDSVTELWFTVLAEFSKVNGRGNYFVRHPELPGCVSDAATLDDAIENLAQVRKAHLAELIEDGFDLPKGANVPRIRLFEGRGQVKLSGKIDRQEHTYSAGSSDQEPARFALAGQD